MIHVSLLALPEADASLLGAMEILSMVGVAWEELVEQSPGKPSYRPQLVSEHGEHNSRLKQWSVQSLESIENIDNTDVIFIPSMWVRPDETFSGRHPAVQQWIIDCYHKGTIVCAACTGAMFLAETGLLEGEKATIHWAYADSLRRHYPGIEVQTDKILVTAGSDQRLITSGGHSTWYDVLLYLINRTCSQEAASQIAKIFFLQTHTDGQLPFMAFHENLRHDDATVRQAQEWLGTHYSHPNPVNTVEKASGLAPSSFKRRFKQVTGCSPLVYTQKIRVERAKSLLENSDLPFDEISWKVGYEDSAFFRRVFKRNTGLAPKEFRRKFKIPGVLPD